MQLSLTYRHEFGNHRYYPECKNGKIIAKLGGFRSFTQAQIDMLRNEGWELDIKSSMPIRLMPNNARK